MAQMIDWGKLVSQGRAKAAGISWSDEEMQAVVLLCKTFNKTMSEVAPYVRQGIFTAEDYKKAQDKPGVVNPYLKLSKDALMKKAQELEIPVSPDATKEVLADIILKTKTELAVKARAEADAKIKEKTEAEANAKAEAEAKVKAEAEKKAAPKAKPKAPVKKPVSKPKAKPTKK
ncbi:MAG TPA: hypothetical protein VMW25_04755 [Clostridia bacterium]|nr:hypothetical protein [Clostridia bacterium]